MFKQARLKLTLWYLSILTLILLFFSAVIYRIGCVQLERSYHQAEMRIKAQELGLISPTANLGRRQEQNFAAFELSQELLSDFNLAKQLLAKNLLFLNLFIIFISSTLAYFLAGKTLAPIEKMVLGQRRFVADAAHELRTPITAMKTALEVSLRDKKMTKKEAVQVLKDNLADIEQLEKLSNQLLTLASYQKEQQQLVLQNASCLELINNLQRKFRGIVQEKQIDLKFKYPEEQILMDVEKVEQLLTILLDNAIAYSPVKKTISVTIELFKKHWQISVKDQGVGMSDDECQQIFERFYRADQSRTKELTTKHGFGLGLAIAKQIVDLYGGKISVQSKLKKGSTFIVKLPL